MHHVVITYAGHCKYERKKTLPTNFPQTSVLFYSNLLFCSNIRCPQFTSLPQGCVLVKPTGQCCAQPQCTGGTGTGTGTGTMTGTGTGTMTGTGTGTMTGTGTGTGTMTGIIKKCRKKHCLLYSCMLANE